MQTVLQNNYEIDESALELYDIAIIGYESTGISNIIIWIGKDSNDIMYIKVSNISNRYSITDNFTILPDLTIIGNINKKTVSNEILKKIKNWIKLNKKTLDLYKIGKIDDSSDFLENLMII